MVIADGEAAAAVTIRGHGWRQGSLFLPNTINLELSSQFPFDPDVERMLICSQSCSVVSPRFKVDPNVEAIVARLIHDIKPENANGKNQRRLHLPLDGDAPDYCGVECDIHRRIMFDRGLLCHAPPDKSWQLQDHGAIRMANWIARHYIRVALPDDLVQAMREHLQPRLKKLLDKLKPIADDIESLYIKYEPVPVETSKPNTWTLDLLFVTKDDNGEGTVDMEIARGALAQTDFGRIRLRSIAVQSETRTFISDLNGYTRITEWDYLTDLAETPLLR